MWHEVSEFMGNDMKEIKTEVFSVSLGRGNERLFLVSISMMLDADTLQIVCSCGRAKARVCPCFMLFSAKENMLPDDNSVLTLTQ